MSRKARILVVDDEARYLRAIQINLEASGYEVLTAQNGQQALDITANQEPNLVLLDIRLPDLDGFEVCRRLRQFSTAPIIMLTALAADADKVKGLDTGADDYVTKPFSAEELMARVRAALRRAEFSGPSVEGASFQAHELTVDLLQRRVFVRNQEVKLTATEYRLLCEFIKHPGRVLVPEYLLENVWGVGYEGEAHLVWQAIHRLRQKIEPLPHQPQYIHTRPGLGYVFTSPV